MIRYTRIEDMTSLLKQSTHADGTPEAPRLSQSIRDRTFIGWTLQGIRPGHNFNTWIPQSNFVSPVRQYLLGQYLCSQYLNNGKITCSREVVHVLFNCQSLTVTNITIAETKQQKSTARQKLLGRKQQTSRSKQQESTADRRLQNKNPKNNVDTSERPTPACAQRNFARFNCRRDQLVAIDGSRLAPPPFRNASKEPDWRTESRHCADPLLIGRRGI